MATTLNIPDLEKRFLPPDNWRITSFTRENREIFYRTAFIEAPKGIVFCLPGLSEFGEKYIETTRRLNTEGFNVVVIDWAYQGLSTRFKDNPHKRHSDGYDTDIADLHHLITQEIKSDLPHYMLAHSMGGHIGLRFLIHHQDIFNAASFSAPMVGIKSIRKLLPLQACLAPWIKRKNECYVPGGHDWHAIDRHDAVSDIFSHDRIRKRVHNAWCTTNPELQVGSPTLQWVLEGMNSIKTLQSPDTLQKINCPTFIAIAGKEKLVDNKATRTAVPHIPQCKMIELKNSKHEILMETDDIRDVFLTETLNLFS
jgi:lysophospholipase